MVFFSIEMQGGLVQIQLNQKRYYSVREETSHKPLKAPAAKMSFPSMYIIDTICLGVCFLFHVIIGRHYFLYKFIISFSFKGFLNKCEHVVK